MQRVSKTYNKRIKLIICHDVTFSLKLPFKNERGQQDGSVSKTPMAPFCDPYCDPSVSLLLEDERWN